MDFVLKSLFGFVFLLGGCSAIVVPIALSAGGTSGAGTGVATGSSAPEGGGVRVEEKTYKWDDESLKKLVKLSVSSLQIQTEGSEIKKVNVSGQEQDSDGKTKWVLSSESSTENLGHSSEQVNDVSGVMHSFLEYVLGEWVEKQWSSTWAGAKWGTSWYPGDSSSVMMTGRDTDQSKKVVLHVNLDKEPKKYVVGQYEVKSEKEAPIGVLSLGFGACSTQEGPQCQIPKNQELSKKIEISFIRSQKS